MQNKFSKKIKDLIEQRILNGQKGEKQQKKNVLNKSLEKLSTIGSKIKSNIQSFKQNVSLNIQNKTIDLNDSSFNSMQFDASSEISAMEDLDETHTQVNEVKDDSNTKEPQLMLTNNQVLTNNNYYEENLTKEELKLVDEFIETTETVQPSKYFNDVL